MESERLDEPEKILSLLLLVLSMRGSIALSGRVAERITAIPQNLRADDQKLWGVFSLR
ncbi:MAG: hypothetical protein AB8B99_13325 [Phormidesmis sp.]